MKSTDELSIQVCRCSLTGRWSPSIFGGTTEIQKEIIARSLGL
jgi:hypothetical protein